MCSVLPTAPTTRTRVPPLTDTFLRGSVVEPPFLERGQAMGCPRCSNTHPEKCPNFRQGKQVSLAPSPVRSQRGTTDDSARSHSRTKENTEVFHSPQDGPQGRGLPVQGTKIGHGWYLSRQAVHNAPTTATCTPFSLLLSSCGLVHGFDRPFRLLFAFSRHPGFSSVARLPPGRQDVRVRCNDFWFQDFSLRRCQDLIGGRKTPSPVFPFKFFPGLGRRFPRGCPIQGDSPPYLMAWNGPVSACPWIQDFLAKVLPATEYANDLFGFRCRFSGRKTLPHRKTRIQDPQATREHHRGSCRREGHHCKTTCSGVGLSDCSGTGAGSSQVRQTSPVPTLVVSPKVGMGLPRRTPGSDCCHTNLLMVSGEQKPRETLPTTDRHPATCDGRVEVDGLHRLGRRGGLEERHGNNGSEVRGQERDPEHCCPRTASIPQSNPVGVREWPTEGRTPSTAIDRQHSGPKLRQEGFFDEPSPGQTCSSRHSSPAPLQHGTLLTPVCPISDKPGGSSLPADRHRRVDDPTLGANPLIADRTGLCRPFRVQPLHGGSALLLRRFVSEHGRRRCFRQDVAGEQPPGPSPHSFVKGGGEVGGLKRPCTTDCPASLLPMVSCTVLWSSLAHSSGFHRGNTDGTKNVSNRAVCGWRGYEREEKEGEREVDNLSTCGCVIQLYLWENTRFIEIREFGWGFLMLTS